MHPFLTNAKNFIAKNSPTILTAMSVGGLVATTVMTASATVKAVELIEVREEDEQKRLSKTGIVKTAWKCYIPAGIMLASTALCIVSANSIHTKRNAALAGAYLLSETAFKEYRDKVKEVAGPKKAKKVEEEIVQDHVLATPKPDESIMVKTGHGDTLCFDNSTGRYFRASVEYLKKKENSLNEWLLKENWLTLNDIYYELGLPPVALGYDLGYDLQAQGLLDFHLGTCMAVNDEPCVTLNLDVKPKYVYYY